MNILVWDQCGQDELQFYIVPDEHIDLLVRCHNKYANSVGASDDDVANNLNKLSDLVETWKPIDISRPRAFDACIFFISGFVP